MVSEKVLHFTGKNKDLNQLSQQIVSQLNSEGYKTQMATPPLGIVIQAKRPEFFETSSRQTGHSL
jgi:hypothetical protein